MHLLCDHFIMQQDHRGNTLLSQNPCIKGLLYSWASEYIPLLEKDTVARYIEKLGGPSSTYDSLELEGSERMSDSCRVA